MRNNSSAFTLVELIVVITILAILGTIAFISLQGYSRDARDSTRTADLGNMKTSLELYSLKTGKYPIPDSFSTITYSGGIEDVWFQGVVGDQVTINLKSLNTKPLDPLTNAPYTYSVTNSYKEYEILALYEGSVAYNSIINQTNAATTLLTPRIAGNYNGVFVKTNNYIIVTPSIITSELGSIVLDGINIKSQVITNGVNIPKNNLSQTKTGALINFNLVVYTGSITKISTNNDKINLMKQIQLAYTGTILVNYDTYLYILNQNTDIELINTINSIYKLPLTKITGDWRDLDSNCDLSDVIIGNQTWAGCNSTIGNGFEWGQTNLNIGTNSYSGTIGGCYNYNAITSDCIISTPVMASNSKAYDWHIGSPDVNNIWGKLYTFMQASSACVNGYHVPSDTEWIYAENQLLGESLNGWMGYSNVNLVGKLGIPLAGYRDTDSSTFITRGSHAILWSSTFYSSSIAYSRLFYWGYNNIYRGTNNKLRGFSVRCIKD